ncbi:MAG TPA: hypothetical protein VE643_05420 [Nitrososphaeraceae archaeon]|nr:hypothetical protein [Nitrososphaeraceae archaeon]
MVCKGVCIRHKASGPISYGRYATGQKRCQICEIFIKWDGIFCPCCGCRLRIGPRLFKDKAKLRIKEKQKEKQIQKALKNTSNLVSHAQ